MLVGTVQYVLQNCRCRGRGSTDAITVLRYWVSMSKAPCHKTNKTNHIWFEDCCYYLYSVFAPLVCNLHTPVHHVPSSYLDICILLEHLDEPSSAWYNYWMLNLLFSIISFYESLLLFTFSMYIQNCRIENRTSVLCRRGSCPIVRPRTRFGFHTRFGICLKLDSGNSEECMRLPRSCSFCFSFVFPLR